ncbi:MAG: hypothetical protein KDB53_07950 [Planctomycetes bacterium]|nr:hypothetical protein [Planctomycetota bacterium]
MTHVSRPALIVNARLGSTRCRNKILRPFADASLIEIALDKMSRLDTDLQLYFGAGEPELIALAANFPRVQLVSRPASALNTDGPPSRVHAHLRELPETHFLVINACHPLVPGELWLDAIRHFETHRPKSLTAVVRNHGWFYDQSGQSLNCRDQQVSATQDSPWIYEVAHAFHLLERDRFFALEAPWTNGPADPELFEIPRHCAWDIDTEDQFLAVERLYEATMPINV